MGLTLDRRHFIQGVGGAVGLALAGPTLAQDGPELPFDIPGSYGSLLPYLKRNAFMKKQAGVSHDRFVREWVEVHGPMMARLPGLAALVLNVVDRDRSPDADFDGFTEFYYRSEAAHDDSYRSRDPQLQEELQRHARSFLDPAMRIFTREVILRDFDGAYPPGAVKRIGLVTRKTDRERTAFLKDWRDIHGPEANRQEGLIRYTLNMKVARLSPDISYDGFAELWWDSWASYEKAAAQRLREREDEVRRGIDLPTQPAKLVFVTPHKMSLPGNA